MVKPLRRALLTVLGLSLTLAAAAPPAPPCALLWGPKTECVLHGEYAKEGLFVDLSGRSFSVGYSDVNSTPSKQALLYVHDSAGTQLSTNYWNVNPFTDIAAGVWGTANGSSIVTVGMTVTTGPGFPRHMVISRWSPGSGTPWTNPVLSSTVVYPPSSLGLLGTHSYGCRVVAASATDLFVSGCTNQEIFVMRIDATTLAPVTGWGTGGVQSVASFVPTGCPLHASPGAWIDFNIYPQAFVEVSGTRTFLGGTLGTNIPGTILLQSYDFVVDCFDTATGAPVWGNGGEFSGGTPDEFMKAMAVTAQGVYATGTNGPSSALEFELVAWRNDGVMRAPGILTFNAPSRGNDVEAYSNGTISEVFVGGYGRVSGLDTGATWHFRHGPALTSPIVLLPQWTTNTSGGANPKGYGPNLTLTDEVFDIGIGRGAHAGYVYSSGAAEIGPGQHVQPLQCIAPSGAFMISNNQSPVSPTVDRATAVQYHGSTTVFTHGTADDASGFWGCVAHWVSRNSRYMP
jgi:hypothetical protein